MWERNPARPFCSMTCKLLDLGEWLDERYRIPGDPQPPGAHPATRDAPVAESGS